MNTLLEKVFPYEGIPEIMLSFVSPGELHEKCVGKIRQDIEKRYRRDSIEKHPMMTVIRTEFMEDLHSFDDKPSIIIMYPMYGHEYYSWHKYGKKHRVNAPATVWRETEEWWEDGVVHRIDGPAVINRRFKFQEWWKKGVLLAKIDL